jgi:hypothetical protein
LRPSFRPSAITPASEGAWIKIENLRRTTVVVLFRRVNLAGCLRSCVVAGAPEDPPAEKQ